MLMNRGNKIPKIKKGVKKHFKAQDKFGSFLLFLKFLFFSKYFFIYSFSCSCVGLVCARDDFEIIFIRGWMCMVALV